METITQKTKWFSGKVVAVSLIVALFLAIGMAVPESKLPGSKLPGSFVSAEAVTSNHTTVTYGDFSYVIYSDKTASVVGYSGTKDLSAASLGIPSVLYASNLDTTWSYNSSIDKYTVTSVNAGIFGGCNIRILGLPSGLQTIFGGFTGAQIGCFTISSSNSYFYATSDGVLYNKSQTTLVAYPSNQSLYSSGTTTASFLSTVTRIEDYAFTNYQSTTLTIPASVTSVGDRVFNGSKLTSVTFNGSPDFDCEPEVTADHGTFQGASNLDVISIKGNGGNFTTYNGALYNKDKTKLILCPQGRTTSAWFVMADSTKEIGNYAFYNCKKLTAACIPESVTIIGSSSFSGINSDFKLYVTQDSYGETYAKNKSMNYVAVYEYTKNTDNTLTITKYNGVYSNISVPSKINGFTVSAIGEEAFKVNTVLTSISLPTTVKSIRTKAFYGCSKLASVSFSNVTTIGQYAFGYCTSLESYVIPDCVTSVGYCAFYGCSNLTSLTIGKGVRTISSYAFCNTGLTSQYIPGNVTGINSYAFGYTYTSNGAVRNSNFTSLSGYPNTAAQTYAENNDITFNALLEYETMNSGTAIQITKYKGTDTSVILPAQIDGLPVTSIKGYAFDGTSVVSITLPESMTTLDGYALYGATKLKTVNFPSGITSIGSYAFEFCISLTSITIPDTVTTIGTGAFYGCTSLSIVNLGKGVKYINKNAFTNVALTNIIIPTNVIAIRDHAFGYTYADSTYTAVDGFVIKGYPGTTAQTYAEDNEITFNSLLEYETMNSGTAIQITKYKGTDTSVILPAQIDGLPVTSIKGYAFDGTSVVSITLPESMTTLDGYALYGATKLKTVNFPSGITSIGSYAFEFCISLTSITIPDTVTTIGTGAFYGCTSLSTVNLGKGLTTIRQYAFTNVALTKVTIPNNVTSIGDHAFGYNYENSTYTAVDGFSITGYPSMTAHTYAKNNEITFNSLLQYAESEDGDSIIITKNIGTDTNIVIPDEIDGLPVTSIKRYAFNGTGVETITLPETMTELSEYSLYGASKLKTVVLPDTMTSIGTYALAFCSSLESCDLPDELTNVGYSAFYNCTNLKKIVIPEATEIIEDYAFQGCSSLSYVDLGKGVETIRLAAFRNTGLTFVTIPESVTIIGEYAFGYDFSSGTNTAVSGFTMIGYVESAAEEYANANEHITFTALYKELVNTSIISATEVKTGEKVTISAYATGGKKPYTYFVVYKLTEDEWYGSSRTEVQEWAENDTIEFSFAAAGTYDVAVIVSDDREYSKELDFTVTVTAAKGTWKKDENGWWYQNPDGTYPKNQWKQINGKWYHFDANGYMQTGWYQEGSTYYYLKSDGSMAVDEWVEDDKYYLDENGKWVKGKVKNEETAGTWKKDENGWWYKNSDGTYPKNQWKQIDGKWYHFDANGYMQTGWYKEGDYYYYLKTDGTMAVDEWVGNDQYYLDENGHWIEGKVKEEETTGTWKKDENGWWYKNSDGTYPKNQWKKIDGKWYHFDENGYIQTGWYKEGDYYYYLKKDGSMACDEYVVDGKYYIDSNGHWVE